MQPSQCPFCSSEVVPETFSGGTFVVTCTECRAGWEVHNSLVRRIGEPDWDIVRLRRTELEMDAEYVDDTPAPTPLGSVGSARSHIRRRRFSTRFGSSAR